jgi:aryl-alcohol dehydrogenase-like predicted oxidoreductase
METRTLGSNGPKISQIGIGVWQASDLWKGDDEQIVRAITRAHELGVNLVDTAEVYGKGHSEEVVGRALRDIGRDEFVVATKVHGANLRYDELQRAAAASMKRLGVSEIDLYQVHWPDPWEQVPLKETMRALEKLYTDGKIRAIGVSNFAVRDLEEARSHLSRTDIVSNQVRYNFLQREIEEEVLPYCRKNNITILAYSPLAQGALTGKYDRQHVPKGVIRDENKLFAPKNIEQIEKVNSVLSSIARRHGCSVSQVALSWLLANQIVVPIPGAKNEAQAEQNVSSTKHQLTNAELVELDAAYELVDIDYLPSVPDLPIELAT